MYRPDQKQSIRCVFPDALLLGPRPLAAWPLAVVHRPKVNLCSGLGAYCSLIELDSFDCGSLPLPNVEALFRGARARGGFYLGGYNGWDAWSFAAPGKRSPPGGREETMKLAAVTNMPRPILRRGVSGKIRSMAG